MRKKLQYIIVFFVSFWSISEIYAQKGGNPFDIEGRENRYIEVNDTSQIFVAKPVDAIAKANDNTDKVVSNPLNVSHVPLQKRDIKLEEKVKFKEYNIEHSSVFDFKFWVLLLSCILFAIVFSLFRDRVYLLARAIINPNFLRILGRENNYGISFFFMLLNCLFCINLSLLFYNTMDWFDISLILNTQFYLFLLVGIFTLYLGKHIILGITGYIFPVSKVISVYRFSVIMFNSILGLLLLPLNIMILFGPTYLQNTLIIIALSLFVMLFLLRMLNGIILASKYISTHFFIYLCSSEIAPLVILYSLLNYWG